MPLENKKNIEVVLDKKVVAESQNFDVKKRESSNKMNESTGSQKNKEEKNKNLRNIKKEDYNESLNENMENSGFKLKTFYKKPFLVHSQKNKEVNDQFFINQGKTGKLY